MLRRGWVGPGARQRSLARFAAAYPMLGERTETCFAAWFDAERPRHADLLQFAQHPGGASQGSRCPLCRFPTARLERPARPAAAVLDEVQLRHPGWRPEAGICAQCADLYGMRTQRGIETSAQNNVDSSEPKQERRST